eukprot:11158107-Lingulodinium_polyedra.AAC.1
MPPAGGKRAPSAPAGSARSPAPAAAAPASPPVRGQGNARPAAQAAQRGPLTACRGAPQWRRKTLAPVEA